MRLSGFHRTFVVNGVAFHAVPYADVDLALCGLNAKITYVSVSGTSNTALRKIAEDFIGKTLMDWSLSQCCKKEQNMTQEHVSLLEVATDIHDTINATLKAFHSATGLKISRIDISPIDGLTVHTTTVTTRVGLGSLSATSEKSA